jgi:hypothetical protein
MKQNSVGTVPIVCYTEIHREQSESFTNLDIMFIWLMPSSTYYNVNDVPETLSDKQWYIFILLLFL